jgi:hypothetical protein
VLGDFRSPKPVRFTSRKLATEGTKKERVQPRDRDATSHDERHQIAVVDARTGQARRISSIDAAARSSAASISFVALLVPRQQFCERIRSRPLRPCWRVARALPSGRQLLCRGLWV